MYKVCAPRVASPQDLGLHPIFSLWMALMLPMRNYKIFSGAVMDPRREYSIP